MWKGSTFNCFIQVHPVWCRKLQIWYTSLMCPCQRICRYLGERPGRRKSVFRGGSYGLHSGSFNKSIVILSLTCKFLGFFLLEISHFHAHRVVARWTSLTMGTVVVPGSVYDLQSIRHPFKLHLLILVLNDSLSLSHVIWKPSYH